MAMKTFKVGGNAASELGIQLEVILELGEVPGEGARWPLLAQWTGKDVIAFDHEHALRMADCADEISNSLDTGLEDGFIHGEERHASRGAMRGLMGLAARMRRWAQ